ncbi:MAG: hypothetical protein NTY63_06705 [Candidatus Bipolaricaulota bacterium]|nr:hypothetical protein [Candidatus Bipolaricaulota bacterium]
MSERSIRHVVVEGLPAVGKTEILALLARFYPQSVRVLPELVKEVVEAEGIDLFRERERLTDALRRAGPERARRIREILSADHLCLEESHLGVHCAYSQALGDSSFLRAYEDLAARLPEPDLYLRLDLPIAESIARQAARGTPQYAIDASRLRQFLDELTAWHDARRTRLVTIDADRPAAVVVEAVERALGLDYALDCASGEPTFGVLLLLGRPASGKSEFIDFMSRLPADERAACHHLGPLEVIDDFPILWRKFEEDDAWERLGRPRLHSRRADDNYAVTDDAIWEFLIDRIDAAARERLARGAGSAGTLLIEFSRGGARGYADAFAALSDDLLSRAAVLYVSVSFEESWRRNLARYDENRRSGILTHSVPREEMERTYGADDWTRLAPHESGLLDVRGLRIPYVTMGNEPESTDPRVLGPRYGRALGLLFALWERRRAPR